MYGLSRILTDRNKDLQSQLRRIGDITLMLDVIINVVVDVLAEASVTHINLPASPDSFEEAIYEAAKFVTRA